MYRLNNNNNNNNNNFILFKRFIKINSNYIKIIKYYQSTNLLILNMKSIIIYLLSLLFVTVIIIMIIY